MPITAPWVILIVGLVVSSASILAESRSVIGCFQRLRALKNAPLAKAIGVFASVIVISGWINGGLGEAFRSFVSLRGFVVYFWAYDAFQQSPHLKERAVLCLLTVGAFAGIWATFQQLTGFHNGTFKYLQGTGFLATPMTFSGTMQIFSLLAIGLLFGRAYRQAASLIKKTPIMLFTVVGNFLGMIFASERSGWLGFVAGIVIASASLPNRRRLANVAACVSTLAVAAWLTIPVVRTRFVNDWQHDPSLTFRLLVWEHALRVFRNHPLFGVGIRHFPQLAVPPMLAPGHAPVLDHAHSNYIHILATLGVVGISGYLYMWWRVVYVSWHGFQTPSPTDRDISVQDDRAGESEPWIFNQGLSFGIMAGAIALLLAGLFEYNFGTGQIRLTQWFVFAMLASPRCSAGYQRPQIRLSKVAV
jgi:O-antigen ligase